MDAHRTTSTTSKTADAPPHGDGAYWTYFGMGHSIKLMDRPGVFRVSPAGLSLGALLVRCLGQDDMSKRFLELGTGSGVLALLLRDMGATNLTATDISQPSIRLACENEMLNFGNHRIHFASGNLFDALDGARPAEPFERIVFNPPGWRAPSALLVSQLASMNGRHSLDLSAMFGGDSVVLRFLLEMPKYLAPGGRAIIGLNSMMGIQDVLARYRASVPGECPLRFRLLERHCFPLLFYSDAWQAARPWLMAEFQSWKDECKSAFSQDGDGTIHWSYEIVECTMAGNPRE
ncbi:methyltransferase [Pendulispora rubella]|uniref:Methyltransferase n=1 Tax=Pendulispora rubella TaxID=2741070 RepID=A0ABZ2LI03_9BACT